MMGSQGISAVVRARFAVDPVLPPAPALLKDKVLALLKEKQGQWTGREVAQYLERDYTGVRVSLFYLQHNGIIVFGRPKKCSVSGKTVATFMAEWVDGSEVVSVSTPKRPRLYRSGVTGLWDEHGSVVHISKGRITVGRGLSYNVSSWRLL